MFDEPDEPRPDSITSPRQRAEEKAEELRMLAELAAVFEGPRKFDAELLTDLKPDATRDLQQAIGKLEKQPLPPALLFLPDTAYPQAGELLKLTTTLSTNDYHIHRRPGETHILRLLAGGEEGEEVDIFYTRLQAHFEAGLAGFLEDERSAHAWRNDPKTTEFLDTLESLNWNLPERSCRPFIRQHGLMLLSTQIIDEINIETITDQIMNRPPAELVGEQSAPNPDEPSDADKAWFFKLFFLRGIVDRQERVLFYTFLQKTDDSFDF